jgi:hypothetical protein
VATLLHRAGPTHPNLLATRARLLARGWRLVPLPANPAAIDRLLAVQVRPVAQAAREIVASFGTAADSSPADVTAPVEPVAPTATPLPVCDGVPVPSAEPDHLAAGI